MSSSSSSRYLKNPWRKESSFISPGPGILSAEQRQRLETAVSDAAEAILRHNERDPSIYVGLSGLAYAFWKLSQQQPNLSIGAEGEQIQSLDVACALLQKSLRHLDGDKHCGFICTDTGPLSLAAVLLPDLREDALDRLEAIGRKCLRAGEWNEVLYGRAGFLYAIFFLNRHLPTNPLADLATPIARAIISDSSSPSAPLVWSWHDKLYLGAAHGTAGTLTMLMSIPDIVNGKEGTAVKGTVDWMADQILRDNGNWPSSLDSSSRPDRLVQWCHGPPGAILCLCRAYDVYKDHTYLDAAKRAAEVVWEKGLLTKGVGLCHGISGNAYSFLHLYALTRDQKYWDRTIRFALFATEWESRTQNGELGVPEHPWSLFEGLAGAVMLWRDVLRLAGAEELDGFPCFMDE